VEPFGLVAQTNVNAVVALAREERVADLEGQVPGVRPVVVKLFERGRAVGVRVVGDERSVLPQPDADAGRAGEAREGALE
jgi:hypothetical protein